MLNFLDKKVLMGQKVLGACERTILRKTGTSANAQRNRRWAHRNSPMGTNSRKDSCAGAHACGADTGGYWRPVAYA